MERNTDTMENIIRKNYQSIREEIADDEINRQLGKDIEELLKKMGTQSEEEKQLRDYAYRLVEAGEEAGVVRGFRYAFQLFLECI